MNKIDFWSEWATPYRLAFKILSVLVLLLILTAVVLQIGDITYFYRWEMTGYMQDVALSVHSSHSDIIESTVSTEVPLLLQRVAGSYQLLPTWVVYLFLAVLYIGVMGILTIVTFLTRFWFVVLSGVFVVVLVGSGIGTVGIIGLTDEMAIGLVSVLFVGLSYYFNALNEEVALPKRFVAFIGLMAIIAVLIYITSALEAPLLQLAYMSYWPALFFSVIFTLIVGHEIVHAILVLTTPDSQTGGSSNTSHFIVLSLVYLINVGLVYMKNVGYIDWDIYYINAFLLLGVSTVLGVWGLKSREALYSNVLPYYPFAIFLYFCFAIICFSSLIFFTLTGNDPTLEVLEDAIIFGHIAYGGMFFIYIFVNFISLLRKNLPVYKIAFKEDNFPYATSKLGALIVVAAFFFVSNYAPMHQAISGYYNGMGDMNLILGDKEKAQKYFLSGSIFGNILGETNGNHRSNFMRGVLEGKPAEVIKSMKGATKKKPSEYAFASLGAAYEEDNRYFEAMFTYQNGLKKFPNSWALKNNLALLHNRTNLTDSAIYYLKDLNDDTWESAIGSSNLIAILTKHEQFDSTLLDMEEIKRTDRFATQNNWLAYQIMSDRDIDVSQVLAYDSPVLNLFTFCYVKNLGIACARQKNGNFLNIVDRYLQEPTNGGYMNQLQFVKGLNQYAMGYVSDAFQTMLVLKADGESSSAQICELLGKWSMELGSPRLAVKYFEEAREEGYPWSTVDLAQAYALTDKQSVGQFILGKELANVDSAHVQIAERLKLLDVAVSTGEIYWSDQYSFEEEEVALAKMIELMKGDDKKAIAADMEILAMINPFFEEGVLESIAYFNVVQKDNDTAYKILQNAIAINSYSVSLIEAYVDQCLAMGLMTYAESNVERLYELLSAEEYARYLMEFEAQKEEAKETLNSWE